MRQAILIRHETFYYNNLKWDILLIIKAKARKIQKNDEKFHIIIVLINYHNFIIALL